MQQLKALSPVFANQPLWDIYNQFVFSQLTVQANKFTNAAQLQAWVAQKQPYGPPPIGQGELVMGDLWPNSLLVQADAHGVVQACWLIDWECTRISVLASDIIQSMQTCGLWSSL